MVESKFVPHGLAASIIGFFCLKLVRFSPPAWVRKLGPFTANAYHVTASVRSGERGMSTDMFFEAIPDDFVDVPRRQWIYRPGSGEVPIIISKEYLALYNFGFAASAGLPQMSEGIMSGIPMQLTLTGRDSRRLALNGRVSNAKCVSICSSLAQVLFSSSHIITRIVFLAFCHFVKYFWKY